MPCAVICQAIKNHHSFLLECTDWLSQIWDEERELRDAKGPVLKGRVRTEGAALFFPRFNQFYLQSDRQNNENKRFPLMSSLHLHGSVGNLHQKKDPANTRNIGKRNSFESQNTFVPTFSQNDVRYRQCDLKSTNKVDSIAKGVEYLPYYKM